MSPRFHNAGRNTRASADEAAVQELVRAGIKVLEGPEIRARAAQPFVPTTLIFGVLQFNDCTDCLQAAVFQRLSSCWCVSFKHQPPAAITAELQADLPGQAGLVDVEVEGKQLKLLLLTGDCLCVLTEALRRSYGSPQPIVSWHEIEPLLTCRAC